MAKAVRLPKLGKAMEEGTIVNALIKPGDKVSKGDVIFEIETDKATMEVESPESGYVKNILIEDQETVPVHTPLAVFGDEDEKIPSEMLKELAAEKHLLSKDITGTDTYETGVEKVDITEIHSSLTAEDNLVKPDFKPGKTLPLTRLQRLLGDRMVQSKQQIPCFYLTIKVDVTDALDQIEKINSNSDSNVIIDDFVMLATAESLQKYPDMTGQLQGDNIVLSDETNIALVMEVTGGAVAPVIKNVDQKDVRQVAKQRLELAQKAANNKFDLDDLKGGCITISNMGPCGVEMFIPVVIPGQCSIIGLGRVIETCVPHRNEVQIRKIMKMSISVDHRIANGSNAAQFLDFIKKTLESPENFN